MILDSLWVPARFGVTSIAGSMSFFHEHRKLPNTYQPSLCKVSTRDRCYRRQWFNLLDHFGDMTFLSSYLSYPLSSFLGLEAYCLFKVFWHTGSLNFHWGTCAPSSCSLCPLSSSLQWTQPSFRFLSLQDWQNREFFLQRLWTLVPGHLSSHSALSSNGLFAPLTLWRLSVSLWPPVQTLGSCPASGAAWSSAMPPSLGRGRVINNNNNNMTFPSESLRLFRLRWACFYQCQKKI